MAEKVSEATPCWGIGEFERCDEFNPILCPSRESRFLCPMRGVIANWERDHVFNPASVVHDGKVHLLYRAEDDSGVGIGAHTSRIGLAISEDGVNFSKRDSPVLYPDDDCAKPYEWPGGCEDPRLILRDDGTFVLTYTMWDKRTARLGIATSNDLVQWTKHGPAFAGTHQDLFAHRWAKSGAIVAIREGDQLIAHRINGKYWMHWGEGVFYGATSDDLIQWTPLTDDRSELKQLLAPRPWHFDSMFVEPGPPSILTGDGIVALYNGKNGGHAPDKQLMTGTYSAGQVLFDGDDPSRVLSRTNHPFLKPERPYECTGQYVCGTVFIEGLVPFRNHWLLYYGTADSCVAVARARMKN